MSGGWLGSLLSPADGDPSGATTYFECTHCEAAFDDWPGPCSRCDQLVVRVVDRAAADPP